MPDERTSGVGEVVQRFLREHVDSYEELETLLLLAREREGVWTAHTIAKRLGTSMATAREALQHWEKTGLAVAQPGEAPRFEYVATTELNDAVLLLADDCDRRRLEIMKLMSKNALDRLRTSAIRTFANAFVLGRKKDG